MSVPSTSFWLSLLVVVQELPFALPVAQGNQKQMNKLISVAFYT